MLVLLDVLVCVLCMLYYDKEKTKNATTDYY